ncbi:MAG: cell division protein, partial [Alphaproteobacteria bacterium]|nr:cell division protein [Alphaproteobacteria bacterium]
MFRPRSDLPLEHDAANRFLPWLIVLIVYLAALALAGLMVLSTAASGWGRGLTGTLTVQIPPAASTASKDSVADSNSSPKARVDKALEVLRATPGVAQAKALSREELLALLEPWLGSGQFTEELSLPALIDVKLKAHSGVSLEGLAATLDAAVPGATIDDHKRWFGRLILLVRSVELIAGGIVLLVSLAAIATVIFVTRTGLAIHHDVIELLHVMGAHDAYIARQFQFQALDMGVRGGAIGFALAASTLLALGYLSARIEAMLLPSLELNASQWLALSALPFVVALISMITARVTVLRA